MTTHSSILTWRTPWTKEPGGLQTMGSQRVGHHWVATALISTFCLLQLTDLFSKVVVLQSQSHVRLVAIPWTAACQASLSFTISQSLLKFTAIDLEMLSNHLILCYPLLLRSIFPNNWFFTSEVALCFKWPKYWSFSF